MRRDEFKCDDFTLIKTMLSQMPFGTMVIPDTPLPYAVPISFCFDENYATKGGIYFHGAGSGRKFELLKNEPSVVFSAVKPYSYIPSRFLSGKMTPTQFFFSVLIEGRFEVVQDLAQKCEILDALVRKYEPQNATFCLEKSPFAGAQKHTFVGVIKVENLSAKAKFGQNMSQDAFDNLILDLQKRADTLDKDTLNLMQHFAKIKKPKIK